MKKIELDSNQIRDAKLILMKYRLGFTYDVQNDCFTDDLINQGNNVFNKVFSATNDSEKAKKAMKDFLGQPYSEFTKNRADTYSFSKIINVPICPYCNEQYIYTVFTDNNQPVTRPEFDHFKKKSKYPKLQLSLLNLVPSCHICNSTLKGQKDFDETTHINPYKLDFDSIMKFDLKLTGSDYLDPNNFEIIFIPRNKNSKLNKLAYNNINVFKLYYRYKKHKDEVVELAKAKKNYDIMKKKEIADILGQSNIFSEEILFPEKNCKINERPLGKLKRDISQKFISI